MNFFNPALYNFYNDFTNLGLKFLYELGLASLAFLVSLKSFQKYFFAEICVFYRDYDCKSSGSNALLSISFIYF